MNPTVLTELVLACAPLVAPDTALAVIQTESAGRPHAIGVVGNALVRQPADAAEALVTARALSEQGWDYSVGLAQINRRNFTRLGLTDETALDPCTNLRAMQTLLVDCFSRAGSREVTPPVASATRAQHQLQRALSCYYSGNFRSGFSRDLAGMPSYVERVILAWQNGPTRQPAHQAMPSSRSHPAP